MMSRAEFADWLRRHVEERAPAAAVRFGDGEAQLLTVDRDDAEEMDAVIGKFERETGLTLSPADVLDIKARVTFAYEEADVLGIRTSKRSLSGHKRWMDRLADFYDERVAEREQPAALAHCMFGHQILDALPELLVGRRVGVISCRDLKPILEGEWGLSDVAVYQVPSQYEVRDIDGPYEAALHRTPIWPDVHTRIRAELDVREPGEVFLVGAGLFGKDLCIHVRERGGIALDMGSALDRMAGKITRGPRRRVLDFHARGVPAEEIPARLQRFYGTAGHHDEISQRIGGAFQAVHADLAAWRARPLAATYRIVCFDAVQVEVGESLPTQSRTLYLAVGITRDGDRDPLGIWWEDATSPAPPDAALDDLRRRGVRDLSVVRKPIDACGTVRKAVEEHGRFPDEQAATTLVYLALRRAENQAPRARS